MQSEKPVPCREIAAFVASYSSAGKQADPCLGRRIGGGLD